MHDNSSTSVVNYLPRSLEPVLEQAMRDFPVVVVVGPRQSGKTTLLRHVVGKVLPSWTARLGTCSRLIPIEIKKTATVRPGMTKSLHSFRQDFGDRADAGYVVQSSQ
jgi:ABC-type phosphate/phosphonate transport system ATPase subunit